MTSHRPFRFGTGCYGARSRREFLDAVRQIEEIGYSIFLCPDHLGFGQSGPLTVLAMASAASPTMRIGTFVLDNDFRHPAVLAKEAATLDVLSDGRLELGLGAGWANPDYTRSGIHLEPPGIRVTRLTESVHVIKRLFSDAPVDFSGTYYTLNGLEGTPKPVQRPHPPLLIAGGSRRILSFAGAEADIVGLVPPARGGRFVVDEGQLASTGHQIEWVREGAGERFSEIELNTLVFNVVVTDDRRSVAEEIAVHERVSPEVILESVHFLVGTVDEMVDEIQMWRERFGISYIAVQQHHRDALGPVVRRLAGT